MIYFTDFFDYNWVCMKAPFICGTVCKKQRCLLLTHKSTLSERGMDSVQLFARHVHQLSAAPRTNIIARFKQTKTIFNGQFNWKHIGIIYTNIFLKIILQHIVRETDK